MRIISGKHRGKMLLSFKDDSIRPTSSYVREMIFNILQNPRFARDENFLPINGVKSSLNDRADFLDVFAGVGSVGLEALSNGAASACFIDKSPNAIGITQKNAEKLGEITNIRLINSNISQLKITDKPYDIIFIDPPYKDAKQNNMLATKTINQLVAKRWVKQSSLVIIEQSKQSDFRIPQGFYRLDERKFAKTKVSFLQAQ